MIDEHSKIDSDTIEKKIDEMNERKRKNSVFGKRKRKINSKNRIGQPEKAQIGNSMKE